jgi:hypothetical protein
VQSLRRPAHIHDGEPISMSWLSTVRAEVHRNLNEAGLFGTLVRAARRVVSLGVGLTRSRPPDRFDDQFGTDTGGVLRPTELDIPVDKLRHAGRYQTAIDDVFLDLIEKLPIHHSEYVFVDLGSGKGRALLLASRWPFQAIIGVELSEFLHRTSERNIAIYSARQALVCRQLTAIHADAATYELPPDKLIIYLFNPFDQHVMQAVLANVTRSYTERPRDVYIAYLKPVHRQVFDQSPFLRVEQETERWVLYRTKTSVKPATTIN